MNRSRILVLMCWFVSAASVSAGPVVLTGDSITVGYAPYVPGAMSVAQSSLDASSYVGATAGQPNRAQMVKDLNPDTIVFMLGANDSLRNTADKDVWLSLYKSNVSTAFDLFEMSTATRVIVLSILPVVEDAINNTYSPLDSGGMPDGSLGIGMNSRVENDFNPWLQSQVASRAKFEYLDVRTAMLSHPTWATDLLHPDGLHPSDPVGQQWLASQVSAAVPEPSSFLFLALVSILAVSFRRLRTRSLA